MLAWVGRATGGQVTLLPAVAQLTQAGAVHTHAVVAAVAAALVADVTGVARKAGRTEALPTRAQPVAAAVAGTHQRLGAVDALKPRLADAPPHVAQAVAAAALSAAPSHQAAGGELTREAFKPREASAAARGTHPVATANAVRGGR